MTPLTILRKLHTKMIMIRVDGDDLVVQAPPGALTAGLRALIRQHKGALVALLLQWEERAAIMEYDGGLARSEAEAQAWHCLQRQSEPPRAGGSAVLGRDL